MTIGVDGVVRCDWANSSAEYVEYHDNEWGREVRGDDAVFERMVLEGFQSGLSWITILRKRENFRAAFANFSIPAVAAFTESDVEKLLTDAGIIRNRAKIQAAIANARAAAALPEGLSEFVWAFAPARRRRAPVTIADVPAVSAESTVMAKALKSKGFRFIGPTTAYAHMQATGMVNDHLRDCVARAACG